MKNPYLWLSMFLLPSLLLTGNSLHAQIVRDYEISSYQSLYMSSPVTTHAIGDALPTIQAWANEPIYEIHRYDPALGWIEIFENEVMVPGKGYVLTTGGNGNYANISTDIVDYPQEYTGTANDGTISIGVGGAGTYNLLGNPYPDFLDADSFLLDADNDDIISGPILLWSKNTVASSGVPGNVIYNFSPNDYALYNVLGGVSAGRAVTKDANENLIYNMNIPNGKIYLGTGFFVLGYGSGGTAKFKNDMRTTTADIQMFRPGTQTSLVTPPERHRIWINLERGAYLADGPSNNRPFRQALIGYADGATDNQNDRVFDAQSAADANIEIDIYSLAPAWVTHDKHLSIQGRDDFNVTDHFQLGYHVTVNTENPAGPYTFTAFGDGMFDQNQPGFQQYYLKDNANGAVYDFPHEINVTSSISDDTRYEVIFINCTSNLTAMNSVITTAAVAGAISYEWHVTNLYTNQVATYITAGNTTHLTDISNSSIVPAPTTTTPFLSYGTSYSYYVVPNNASESQTCIVTTPIPTVGMNCGSLNPCSQITFTNTLTNTLHGNYIVKVVGSTGTQTATISWNPGSFYIWNTPLVIAYGETYQISVQVDNPGGAALAFSTACTFNAAVPPTAEINEGGMTLSACGNLTVNHLANCLQHKYNFIITGADNIPHTYPVNYSPGHFYLEDMPGICYGATYTVAIQIQNAGGQTLAVGTPHTITISTPTTMLLDTSANLNLTSYCSNIKISNGLNCLLRNFNVRVTDANNNVYLINNVSNSPGNFDLPALPSGTNPFNQSFSVEVQILNPGGSALPWGSPKTVTTPTFPTLAMKSAYCSNYMVPNASSLILGNLLISSDYCTYSKQYRFKLTNASNSADSHEFQNTGNSVFNLNSFSGLLLPSTQYFVQIAPRINGVLGSWSTATCTITTPTTLRPGENIAEFDVIANPNPFERGFLLSVESRMADFITVSVYDMIGRCIERREIKPGYIDNETFGENYAAGVYNIIVTQGPAEKTLRIIKR
jgi:hypothetical protein